MANCALGDLDAVTSGWFWENKSSNYCPNRIWLNDGSGSFSETNQILTAGVAHSHGVALGDLNGDKSLDMILNFTGEEGTYIYLNNGNGGFEHSSTIQYAWFDEVVPADMDNDGDLDLIAANGGPQHATNSIWLNDGSGVFSDSGVRIGNDWTWDLTVGDLDNNGSNDIVYANFGFEESIQNAPNTAYLNTIWDAHWPQNPPNSVPEVFMPGIISVEGKNSHALNFSPDGNTMIFSRYPDAESYIMSWNEKTKRWSDPEKAYFHGKEVCFSNDGSEIYYYNKSKLYRSSYPQPASQHPGNSSINCSMWIRETLHTIRVILEVEIPTSPKIPNGMRPEPWFASIMMESFRFPLIWVNL